MPELKKTQKGYSLEFSEKEARELGLDSLQEYEFLKAKDGVFLLLETGQKKAKSPEKELEEKVFQKLSSAKLSDRVEGKFESLLTPKEKECFKKLREKGQIVPFKLSEKYKKAIYKTRKELDSNTIATISRSREFSAQGKTTQKKENKTGMFSLERDDFTVTKNESIAKMLSKKYAGEIKRKEILGVKSFDGEYFVVKKELYSKHSPEILKFVKEHSPVTAEKLSDALNLKKALVRAICELLKEKGEITEKRKELYAYVP